MSNGLKRGQAALNCGRGGPEARNNHFTLGGIVVDRGTYEEKVKPALNQIKLDCFGSDTIILHEAEIRAKKGAFESITADTQRNFFNGLRDLIDSIDEMRVLAVSANTADLDRLYKEDDRNDIYYIALQLLMENFTQFLSANDGVGTVYLESTDQANNARLQNLFHLLKATGTLFVKKETLQKRLSTINFAIKADNIAGLQIADFIPNPLARAALEKKQKPNSIYESLKNKLYDGAVGLPNRFGFKIIK